MEEQKDNIGEVIYWLSVAFANQAELFSRYERIENLYYGRLKKKKYDWQSNIDLGIAHELVETVVAEEIKALREQESLYTHLKAIPEGKKDIALAMSKLIDYHRRKMNFQSFLIRWLKNAHLFGTSVARVFFKAVKGEKFSYEEESGEYKIIKKPYMKFFQPFYEVISPYCFFIDPNAEDIKNASFVAVLRFENIDYLRRRAKIPDSKYKNLDKVKAGTTTLPFIRYNMDYLISGYKTILNTDKNLVDILEFWQKTDNGIKFLEIANGATIIREIENPYWFQEFPFVEFTDTINPAGFFGKGLLDPAEAIIKERKEIRDLRLENMKALVHQTILGNRYADIDWDEIEKNNKPDGLILTDDVTNTFKYLERPDILRSAYLEDEGLSKQIQSVTGIWDYLKGATPPRSETATGIMRLQQAAASRINIKIFQLFNAIDRLTYFHLQMCRQFIRRVDVPIVKNDGTNATITLTPPDFDFYLDVLPLSGNLTQLDIEMKRQKLLQLLALPVFNQPNVNIEALQRLVIKLFDMGNFEDFFISQKEIPATQEVAAGTPAPITSRAEGKGTPSIKGVSATPVAAMETSPEKKIPPVGGQE